MPIEGKTEGEKPDIQLRVVKGDDIAQVVPGSKNLVIQRELDRDEVRVKNFGRRVALGEVVLN